MKRSISRVALAALAFTFSAGALAQGASTPAPAIAPLNYQTRTLANGLRVYSIRDANSANVSVQVWYDVGSKDDPRGRSGFAHLFEHIMFKATRNMVPEQFDRLTEDVGGFNNASTNDDYTNYYEVVPANHLQRLLWAEAERMGSLVVEEGFFNSERDVVKEEFRSRVLAAPYGRLFYLYLPQISYDVHPYARPGIGSIEDLDAATIDDVRAFHATYYRPDNAVLVVAGNFDQAELDRWVDQYFAPLTRPATAIPRVTVEEPARRQARNYTVYEPNTPLPAVLISYPAPPARSDDAAAMEVLDGVLSTGESSRLHQSLVYSDRIAAQASSFLETRQGRGNLGVYAILSAGQTAEAGETGLRREIARFRDGLVTPAELEEAKNELLTSALGERETVDGQASALAQAVIVDGDPRAADERLARIAAVTPADIQRVALTWLREDASAGVRYLPDTAQEGAGEDTIATADTVQTAALTAPADIPIIQPASEAERVAPPAPGPEIVPTVPRPNTQRLANGLTVITVENHMLPLVTASLVTRGGSAADTAGRAGTAGLTAAVMTEGTATRSATEIDRAVEALGTSLDSGAGWDGSQLGLTVQTGEIDAALGIVADVARHASLPDEEIERQRTTAIDGVTVSMSDPGEVAQMAAMRALYGAGAYGHPSGGTVASLRAITRADIEGAYRSAWAPANATLILSGDIDPAQARALAERHFGNWNAQASAATAAASNASAPARGNVVVVDMPGSGQAAVAVAREGLSRRDPRFYRALVANAILGGGYSARLNQEIRIRRGLSYGSGSSIDARREAGPFLAVTQTRNAAADQVLALTLSEMQRLGSEAPTAADLAARRASLTGGFGRSIETTSGVAGLIAGYVLRGIGPETLDTYLPSVLAVTPADVQSVAAELLPGDGSTIVIVGEASQFADRLRQRYPNLIVIPLSALNLDTPTLR
ncbi:pitrilysin family protein [Sphingosinicella sp. LHD-64]|uniref:M16 family metallopeptidase n=1 Tax=Sphingosinicella sp. LHD-64 TaxID=3072139 RepID=UPI00280EBC13|nr:pitrilysin family protein [Sphingosinicella sp. LHD-64]MDQ8756614.1 pitrilysin family protein [Sphingosinicella sp. LHD-64]